MKRASLALILSLTAALTSALPAVAANVHNLRIVNAGKHAVATINISSINRQMWGPDLLGNSILFPGQTDNFSIGEGCLEDIRIIYRNGHVVTQGAFNTCKYDVRLSY